MSTPDSTIPSGTGAPPPYSKALGRPIQPIKRQTLENLNQLFQSRESLARGIGSSNNLSQKDHLIRNKVTIEATPSVESTQEPIASGALLSAPSANMHHHESFTYWGGKRYKFILDLPIKSGINKEEFDEAIKKHRDVFLRNLQEESENKKSKIQAGVNFSFLFTERGYVAYMPNDKIPFDPQQPVKEVIQSGYMQNPLEVHSAAARSLSKIIQEATTPDAIAKGLESSEPLKSYFTSKSAPSTTTSPTGFRPIGFFNSGNTCYLSAAVQSLASNPIIRQELLQNGVIPDIEGKAHPLKIALEEYEKAQNLSYESRPIDLTALRDLLVQKNQLSLNTQEDASEALAALTKELCLSPSSPLYSIVQSSSSHLSNDGREIWSGSKEEFHCIGQKKIIPESGKSLDTLLKEQLIGDLEGTESDTLTKLHKKEIFTKAPAVLIVQAQRSTWLNGAAQKMTTEIDAHLELELDGSIYGASGSESTFYDLMSFVYHQGDSAEGGHYLTYVRDGHTFWEINDSQKKQIPEHIFLQKAKSAYYYVYNQKGLAVETPIKKVVASESQKTAVPPAPPVPPTQSTDTPPSLEQPQEISRHDLNGKPILIIQTGKEIEESAVQKKNEEGVLKARLSEKFNLALEGQEGQIIQLTHLAHHAENPDVAMSIFLREFERFARADAQKKQPITVIFPKNNDEAIDDLKTLIDLLGNERSLTKGRIGKVRYENNRKKFPLILETAPTRKSKYPNNESLETQIEQDFISLKEKPDSGEFLFDLRTDADSDFYSTFGKFCAELQKYKGTQLIRVVFSEKHLLGLLTEINSVYESLPEPSLPPSKSENRFKAGLKSVWNAMTHFY